MIQTRRVQPTDLEYIFKHAESLGFQQDVMVSRLENMMLVIEGSKICGIGFYLLHENKCLLNWIHIHQDYRRDKLGTMLVKTMLSTAEQQGALQAYICGSCDEFAEFLGFERILDEEQAAATQNLYLELFQGTTANTIYKVSLIDYFKACCHK